MKHSTKRTRRQIRTRKQSRSRRQRQRGGTVFTTQEKDNLVNDGGFTYEQLDYLTSLPNNFRTLFGSTNANDYDFIKSWQKSVSELYDIPPTSENMKELAAKTIEDFKYFFERRASQAQEQEITPQNDDMDVNISSVTFGGRIKRRHTRRRSNKKA